MDKGAMPMLSLALNVLWLLCGGLFMAAGWIIAGVAMALTIIGLPWTRAAFTMAGFTLLPFGHRIVARARLTGRRDLGSSGWGTIGNVVWLVFAGWWLAIGHLVAAAALAITIIGLPFAWAHLKLAGLALWPIGRTIASYG